MICISGNHVLSYCSCSLLRLSNESTEMSHSGLSEFVALCRGLPTSHLYVLRTLERYAVCTSLSLLCNQTRKVMLRLWGVVARRMTSEARTRMPRSYVCVCALGCSFCIDSATSALVCQCVLILWMFSWRSSGPSSRVTPIGLELLSCSCSPRILSSCFQ